MLTGIRYGNLYGQSWGGKNIYFVYALRDGTLVYIESDDQVGVEADQICLADGSNRRFGRRKNGISLQSMQW